MKLCECGCGLPAPIASKTNRSRGNIKGQRQKFIRGHNARLQPNGKVEYDIEPITGCWLWKRSIISTGYGHLRIHGRYILAHRYVYEKVKGKIPPGYDLDHLCRNHRCINPDHLEPVSHAENCYRGLRAKLNKEFVQIIRDLYNRGTAIKKLSQDFMVNYSTIRRIVRRISWK